MSGQSIRRSQFITTYGPGAILEGPNGPRIIPLLSGSEIFDDTTVNRFEITDLRLSTALLNGAGIVRLPSNAELGLPETHEVYRTIPFPSWALCTQHNILYLKRKNDGRPRHACPRCQPRKSEEDAWIHVRRQAIRFVRACPDGHLDDVDWHHVVDHRNQNCTSNHYEWRGGGSALKNINIVCPHCGGSGNLGVAYSRKWFCSGRFPEQENARNSSCSSDAQIIQRGAANLHLSEIYSALTIPPSDTRLHRLLESPAIQLALQTSTNKIRSKQDLLSLLGRLVPRFIGQAILEEIGRFQDTEIVAALDQLYSRSLPQDNRTMRIQEFDALQRAADVGAPPQPSSSPGSPPQFEVVLDDVRTISTPSGHVLRITPISRLRVVMVQRGYRRLDPLQSKVVDVCFTDVAGRVWYPGTELFGEGIFIDLMPSTNDRRHFELREATPWWDAWYNPDSYGQHLHDPADRDYLHPVFVWWHTLAHRLINALSIDSGYSSAAVRERVYIRTTDEDGRAEGGLLMYTAQPGGDGTLGGLIALVPQFERVLRSAMNTIDACSNDPLCSDEVFRPGRYNGAACYACELVSETSCEHRNTRLDRTLLVNNLP